MAGNCQKERRQKISEALFYLERKIKIMKQGTFEDVKDRIIYVLENAAAAEKDGRPIPHEDYLDMIKTFRVCRHDGDYDFNVT